jgi:hypothetical protein
MKILQLPIFEEIYYTYAIGLENQRYLLTFLWNERDSAWRMDIRHEDQKPIVLGYKLVPSYPMMADYSLEDDGLSGYFILIHKSQENGVLSKDFSSMAQYYNLYYIYEG